MYPQALSAGEQFGGLRNDRGRANAQARAGLLDMARQYDRLAGDLVSKGAPAKQPT